MYFPTVGAVRPHVPFREIAAFRERQVCAVQVAFSPCPEPLLHDSLAICSCNFELQIAWNIFSFLCAHYAIHATDVLQQAHPVLIPFTLLLPYICARLILNLFMWAINHSMVSNIKIKRISGLWMWQVTSSYRTTWQGTFFFFGWKYSRHNREGFFYLCVFTKRTCKCVRGDEMGNSQLLSSC